MNNQTNPKNRTRTMRELTRRRAALQARLEASAKVLTSGEEAAAAHIAQCTREAEDLAQRLEAVGPVLLDTDTGDYIPAQDDSGRNVYRVRVDRCLISDVYDVTATTPEQAVRKALRLQDCTPVRWAINPPVARLISAKEN